MAARQRVPLRGEIWFVQMHGDPSSLKGGYGTRLHRGAPAGYYARFPSPTICRISSPWTSVSRMWRPLK